MKKILSIFSFVFCLLYSIILNGQIDNCQIPPTPIIMNGLAVNLINNAGSSEITVNASDFNVASYSECSTILTYSFSENINETYQIFDCTQVGFQSVQIWVTDEQGNQSTAFTYLLVQDFFGLCFGGNVSDCNNSLVVYNGIATALANNNQANVPVELMVKRVEENCVGEEALSFEYLNFEDVGITFGTNNLGTQSVAVQLKVGETLSSKISSFVLVQLPLTTNNCIPVPVVHNGLATSLDSNGTLVILASAFDVGSYSNCGGNVALSFSADSNDRQKTFDCSNLGTNSLDIWVTDLQTGGQNKVSTYVLVQDITESCETDCPANYTFPVSEVIEAGTYKAVNYIQFQNTVDFSESITLAAGNYINLLPGTHIQENSNFLAKIEDCVTSSFHESLEGRVVKHNQIALTPNQVEKLNIHTFPNPFQSQTTIQYHLPNTDKVNLHLTDFLGREVRILTNNQEKQKGWHEIQLDAKNLPSGTYFVVLNHNGQLKTQKIILFK